MRRRRKVEPPPDYPQWRAAEFEIARPYSDPAIERVRGWEYRGLGLHVASEITARYVRKDGTRRIWRTWAVTHLNTGHLVRALNNETLDRTFLLVTDLAEMADWSFDGLEGWRNTEPDMGDKMQAWHRRHQLAAYPRGMARDEGVARAIGMKRW